MIIASCGTRLSFGSCDHLGFAEIYGGVALSICINKRIYVILRQRNNLEEYRYRISYSETELCNSVEEIQLNPVREAIKMVGVQSPLEVIYFADVPAKLGLATSSAFILALLKALYTLKGDPVPPEMLAENAYTLEREIMAVQGGFQDHEIWRGGINYLIGKPHKVTRHPVVLNSKAILDLESHLLLVYTGNRKSSEDVLTEQLQLLKSGATLEQTLRIKKLIEEMYTIMCNPAFKPMDLVHPIKEQWELKKQLSSSMVTDAVTEIENIVLSICSQAGLRLVGSGGRGCMLVLSPPEYREKLIEALYNYICSPVSIDWEGCRVHDYSKTF
jgi:D-glycero-alpha-D-manno-heptose-7-phosphate kinase